jgi:hypothetical protein
LYDRRERLQEIGTKRTTGPMTGTFDTIRTLDCSYNQISSPAFVC